eukprot:537293-Amphidinium_carterae.1
MQAQEGEPLVKQRLERTKTGSVVRRTPPSRTSPAQQTPPAHRELLSSHPRIIRKHSGLILPFGFSATSGGPRQIDVANPAYFQNQCIAVTHWSLFGRLWISDGSLMFGSVCTPIKGCDSTQD